MTLLPATPAGVAAAVEQLRAGGLLGLPTETVYGLAADAGNPAAVAAVFARKQRPANHPLIVHLATAAEAQSWVREWPPAAQRLAEAFWPGPLTLVLPRAAAVLSAVTGGQETVALRVPEHPLAREVLRVFGGGLVAPSANRYGRLSPTRAADVVAEFGADVPVLDGGECAVGLESTIVACLAGEVRVLRPGVLTPSMLSRAIGEAVLVGPGAADPRVPGSVRAHYAPRTPLAVVPAAQWQSRVAAEPAAAQLVLAGSTSGLADGGAAATSARLRCLPDDAVGYGRALYATLRELDSLGAPRILVAAPPPGEAWAAVRDRLLRAAAAGEIDDAPAALD